MSPILLSAIENKASFWLWPEIAASRQVVPPVHVVLRAESFTSSVSPLCLDEADGCFRINQTFKSAGACCRCEAPERLTEGSVIAVSSVVEGGFSFERSMSGTGLLDISSSRTAVFRRWTSSEMPLFSRCGALKVVAIALAKVLSALVVIDLPPRSD